MKYGECAETNEKAIFRFLQFLVFEILTFYAQNWQFSMNFYYNSKNKNLKHLKINF